MGEGGVTGKGLPVGSVGSGSFNPIGFPSDLRPSPKKGTHPSQIVEVISHLGSPNSTSAPRVFSFLDPLARARSGPSVGRPSPCSSSPSGMLPSARPRGPLGSARTRLWTPFDRWGCRLGLLCRWVGIHHLRGTPPDSIGWVDLSGINMSCWLILFFRERERDGEKHCPVVLDVHRSACCCDVCAYV